MSVGANSNDRIASYLDLVSTYDHAFTLDELADLAYPGVDRDALQNTLKSDVRFTSLGGSTADQAYFVAKKELFLWFARLTRRLAEANQNRLTAHQLVRLMNSLSIGGRWDVVPVGVIEFGQRFGFIGPAHTPAQYVFPLAHILSLIPQTIKKLAWAALESIYTQHSFDIFSDHFLPQTVHDALSNFNPKVSHVLQARAGLTKSGKRTLEQIGVELHLSRERVRQLERKCWKELKKPTIQSRFIVAFLGDLMRNHGKLIIEVDSSDAPVRQFIVDCISIPLARLSHSKLVIIGASSADMPTLKSTGWFPEETDATAVATRLDSDARLCLIDQDMRAIAENIVQFRRKQCTKGQKAYLALRVIGRPADSAEITEVYNSLFPDSPSTEYNLHAVLGREEYGVVWIGVRSTFALQEWGYEHPQKTLFDTVAEIVHKKFLETASSVPFEVIIAEIGKYRKVVRPASLTIAAYCNPALQCASKNSFVPKKDSVEEMEEGISTDELDRILKEFEFGTILSQNKPPIHELTGQMIKYTERTQESTDLIQEVRDADKQSGQGPQAATPADNISRRIEEPEPKPDSNIKRVAESTIYNYPPEFFFSLAHWAKEKGKLNPWERRLAFDIGRYRVCGWLISEKQERHGLRIIEEARKLGFTQDKDKTRSAAEDVDSSS